jgi:transcriptional repressor NrdR
MKCPFCAELENKVIDSRLSNQGAVIRRRRECLGCQRRFTTYERVEEILPMVVKKDGRREAFDRQKVIEGLKLACQKRPVSAEQLQALVSAVERELQELGEKEIRTTVIGEGVMRRLRELDEVAYVRFASVYRAFRDVGEFMTELAGLARTPVPAAPPAAPPARAGGEEPRKKGERG